jgi:hypothetical protein
MQGQGRMGKTSRRRRRSHGDVRAELLFATRLVAIAAVLFFNIAAASARPAHARAAVVKPADAAAVVKPNDPGSATAKSADACSQLDSNMVELATAAAKANGNPAPAAVKANRSPAPAAAKPLEKQEVLNYFFGLPTPFYVQLSSTWVANGDPASLTFTGKRIEAIKDIASVCIAAFDTHDANKTKRISRFFLETVGNNPQDLKVVFDASPTKDVSPSIFHRFYFEGNYTFIGILTDSSPPFVFSYSPPSFTIINKFWSTIAAIIFVLAFYVGLARVTADKDDITAVKPCASRTLYWWSPVRISAAAFGEASMSQVQVLLFTFIVAGLLFQLWLRTGVLSDISTQLLLLLGISAVGAGGAKFTQTIKTDLSDSTSKYLIGKGWYAWPKTPMREHATFGKLLLTDDRLDVYKFQMAIFTVVVAAYVISAGQNDLSNVNISDTMLYLIGISQGVYVGGKAITDRTTDLESAVGKMMDLESKIQDLTTRIAAVKAPDSPADLTAQKAQRIAEYIEAARTAVKEYAPLTLRRYPSVMVDDKPKIDPKDGQPEIDPAVLKPSVA